MKIGFFGDGIWAQKALRKIFDLKNIEVSFIVPRYNCYDNDLIKIAEECNIRIIKQRNVNDDEFLRFLKNNNTDLLVSMSFDQILKKNIINLPPKGFINCHAGALPYYRGRNVINWALINDEKYLGITVHYVDEGIDTGDIILQKKIPISIEDNYSTLLKKAYIECSNVLIEALILIQKDKVIRTKQSSIHPVGFYCGRRVRGDELMDWKWSSRRIFNFVRAITKPGPCARTYYKNQEIAIIKCELIKRARDYICTEGEVVGKRNEGIIVKTGDNSIIINKVADIFNDSLINERIPDFQIGERLGLNLYQKVMELEKEIADLKNNKKISD